MTLRLDLGVKCEVNGAWQCVVVVLYRAGVVHVLVVNKHVWMPSSSHATAGHETDDKECKPAQRRNAGARVPDAGVKVLCLGVIVQGNAVP